MRKEPQRLCLILLLVVVSQIAYARQIPMDPVQLSIADQREILSVLGLDPTQVRSIKGFQVMRSAGVAPGTIAMVNVAGEALAPRIESGREVPCHKSESRWTCDTESVLEILYVSLPEECLAEVAPSVGGRILRMPRDNGPSVREALSIVELICTSEQMAEQAWALEHEVISARRNVDGELEVLTTAPDTDENGFVFVLEERCDKDVCQLVIGGKHGWMT